MYVTSGLRARNKRRRDFSSVIEHQEKRLRDARKPYKPSKWARGMVNAIKKQKDENGNFQAGGKVLNELDKRGAFCPVPKYAKQDVDKVLKSNKLNEGGFGEQQK